MKNFRTKNGIFTGDVGIGTTSPGYILHVLEDNSAVYNPTGASSTIYQQSIVNVNTSADTGAFLSLSSNSNQTGTSIIGSIGGSNAKDSQLVFLTRDGSATGDPIKEHMRIDSGGNVGIGTTSPNAKLHVDSGEAELTFGNNASGGNANLRIWRNDSSITIDNPIGYLSFAGSDAATSPTDHAAISAIAEESHEYTSAPLSEKNGTQLTFFTTNLGQSAMSRKMTISANGNVGIGTTSPDEMLTLTDKSSWVSQTNGPAIQFEGQTNNGTLYHFAKIKAISPAGGINNAGQLGFYTTNAGVDVERVRIDEDGNVGIGTTSPDYKLDVKEAANSTYAAKIFNGGGDSYGLLVKTNSGTIEDFPILDLENTAGNVFRVQANGNVGIGTTSPQHILDVRLSEDLTTFVGNQTPGVGIKNENTAVDNVALLAFKASQANTVLAGVGMINRSITAAAGSSVGDLAFYSKPSGQANLNDDPSMIIDSDGNVGIGTAGPGAKLEISGGGTGVWLKTNNLTNRPSNTMAGPNATPTDENTFEIGPGYINLNRDDTVTVKQISFGKNGTLAGYIETQTDTTSYVTSSDYRLKENVIAIDGAIERVNKLKPCKFNFIKTPEKVIDGFLAHEVQEIVPEAISGEKDAEDENGNIVPQGIDQSKLVPLLTAAIQEQQQLIEQLKSQNESLAARISALES